jgi:hypothetical protein
MEVKHKKSVVVARMLQVSILKATIFYETWKVSVAYELSHAVGLK